MPDAALPETHIVLTGPLERSGTGDILPSSEDGPSELVFCCFFRTVEDRSQFLGKFRQLAQSSETLTEADAVNRSIALADAYDLAEEEGRENDALLLALEWWIGIQRRGYHVYTLKVGAAAFRTSCVIAFRPLAPATIRAHIDRALLTIEEERTRVLDFFGL